VVPLWGGMCGCGTLVDFPGWIERQILKGNRMVWRYRKISAHEPKRKIASRRSFDDWNAEQAPES
jgi:hypothetical protein